MTSRLALLLSLIGTGCTVASLDEFELADVKNSCSENSDCSGGICQGGQCRAQQGSFDTLLIEVTAPANSPQVAGLRYLRRLDNLVTTGGDQNVDLQVATVTGTLTPEVTIPMACEFNRELSPIKLKFTPSDRLLGLSAQSHQTIAKWEPGGYGYNFKINIPPGDYDIYAEASVPPDADQCPVAPQLYRRQSIGAGPLSLRLFQPQKLTVKIEAPIELSGWPPFSGWTVDMIDPITRSVLSTTDNIWDRVGEHLVAEIYYSPVFPPDAEPGLEQIRLTPAAGVVAPTLHFERRGIELLTRGEAVVSRLPLLPPPVDVEGEVTGCVTTDPNLACTVEAVAAKVKIAANELPYFERGVFASYEQTETADDKGKFVVKLLPGKYRVIATPPPASKLAGVMLTDANAWTVSDHPSYQAGRVIELEPAVTLNGVVMDPAGGRAMTGATVQALASPASVAVDALDRAVGEVVFVPTASAAVVESTGDFLLRADPGVYDLSVRPSQNSGFAWLVKPRVEALTSPKDLGVLRMPLPIAYKGIVTAPFDANSAQPVPRAVVRAYVYMSSKTNQGVTTDPTFTSIPTEAESVLQVGETRADEDGNFELLVPAGLQ